jgi:ABC-type sugar transport system permease subunit
MARVIYFYSPWLIGFFVFTLAPILASLFLAFTQYDILTLPNWIGFENFDKCYSMNGGSGAQCEPPFIMFSQRSHYAWCLP